MPLSRTGYHCHFTATSCTWWMARFHVQVRVNLTLYSSLDPPLLHQWACFGKAALAQQLTEPVDWLLLLQPAACLLPSTCNLFRIGSTAKLEIYCFTCHVWAHFPKTPKYENQLHNLLDQQTKGQNTIKGLSCTLKLDYNIAKYLDTAQKIWPFIF